MTRALAKGTMSFVRGRGSNPFFLCFTARSTRIPHIPKTRFMNGDNVKPHNSYLLRFS